MVISTTEKNRAGKEIGNFSWQERVIILKPSDHGNLILEK